MTAIPAPKQKVCPCQGLINLVPWADDTSVLIPVDVDRDPDGSLLIIGSRRGFTVRPLREDETSDPKLRRRAHWDRCPRRGLWGVTLERIGLRPSPDRDRSGPCALCGQRHPWHYGGPIASPLCDACRTVKGLHPMGEK